MAKSWQEHLKPHLKKAMSQAVKSARKTWSGKKELTPAKKKLVNSLQSRREEINAKIRKIKNGGK